MKPGSLPYFDFLLTQLARNDAAVASSFGRHVHWGYWGRPEAATCDADDYAQAAEQLTLELCATAGVADGQTVLDVGCGFGGTLSVLDERHAGMALTGLNIDFRQLSRARSLLAPRSVNSVALCQGDACSLPFEANRFDRVLAVECIFHFPSRERFLQEAWRVLKPGGVLALSDFVPAAAFLPFVFISGKAAWSSGRNYFGRCDVSSTLNRYRSSAQACGFRVKQIRNVTRHTLPTYRYLKNWLATSALVEARGAGGAIDMMRLISRAGLLKYCLIALQKP